MPKVRTPIPVRRSISAVAEHLTSWRKLRGLTQAQVAERAGVSRSTVQKLERGDGGVSLESLIRVLRALGLSEVIAGALDPLATDVGRMRSEERLPERVRPKRLGGDPDR